MRGIIFIGLCAAVIALTGCQPATVEVSQIASVRPPVIHTGVLLFDGWPSEQYSAQDFANRSGWPQTSGDISLGQLTEYEELYIDRERGFPNWHDDVYRRFRARRTGASLR